MMLFDGFGAKKKDGLLKKPQRLHDAFSGRFVAYQGQRPGSLPHRVVIYVKEPNSNEVVEIVDVPESAIFHTPPVNAYSPPEGHWTLMAGPEGMPTLADKLLDLKPEVYQKMSEAEKRANVAAAGKLIAEKQGLKTQEQLVEQVTSIQEKVQDSVHRPFGFMEGGKPNRSLVK